MKKAWLYLLLFSFGLGGCAFDSTYTAPMIWLDAPIEDFETLVGTNIPVQASSGVNDPGLDMYIVVNGEIIAEGLAVTQQSEENRSLFIGSGYWTVPTVGDFHLRVRLISSRGNEDSDEVVIRAYQQATAAPLLPATSEPSLYISPLPPFILASPTSTKQPTFIIEISQTPLPPIEINFWANEMEITKGNCTVLHWEVKNANRVSLNGNSVNMNGKQKTCPDESATYTLRAQNTSDSLERSLDIKVITPAVTIPPDTSGPMIQQIQKSYPKIYWPPDCSPAEVVISALVNDPSGVKTVSLFYRLVDGKRQGQWRERSMNLTSTNTYAHTLTAKDLQASLNPPVENAAAAALQYYLLAIDNLGNRNQSKPYSDVAVDYCLY